MQTWIVRIIAVVAALGVGTSRSDAGFAAVEFTSPDLPNGKLGGGGTLGYQFRVTSPLFATALVQPQVTSCASSRRLLF